jgi:hypothetical protein
MSDTYNSNSHKKNSLRAKARESWLSSASQDTLQALWERRKETQLN